MSVIWFLGGAFVALCVVAHMVGAGKTVAGTVTDTLSTGTDDPVA